MNKNWFTQSESNLSIKIQLNNSTYTYTQM